MDIARAQGQSDLAAIKSFGQPLGYLIFVGNELDIQMSLAFDRLIERLAGHPGNRIFAGWIDDDRDRADKRLIEEGKAIRQTLQSGTTPAAKEPTP